MTNPSQFETLRRTAAANRFQIATLIESLLRSVELLTVDIQHEETREGCSRNSLSDPDLSGAGAEPEVAKGEHQGDHCFVGGIGFTRQPGGVSRRRSDCRASRTSGLATF